MSPREFRSLDSYNAERESRDMIEVFLTERGFRNVRDRRKPHGVAESQTIYATSPSGEDIAIRVRLCWRRRNPGDTFSAAQLLFKIKDNDAGTSIQRKIDREVAQGVTHTLFFQREYGLDVSHAALIPQSEILSVWRAQRDAFASLLKLGRLGRKKKNPAVNGDSPTLWLHDENAPEANDAVWKHSGVIDLLKLEVSVPQVSHEKVVEGDTFDDLTGYDPALIGGDEAVRVKLQQSGVKRDPRVRREVLTRANWKCENDECGTGRAYKGFLDVHHILGVEKSDRVWNCVALCPNCHREAHASPDEEALNAKLLSYANAFKPSSGS